MSFGFAIGDVIQVATLAWNLYRDCYKVAREAPQDFQLLVSEMSTMSNSLVMLREEIKDPDSTLSQSGEERVQLVNDMVHNIFQTLLSLEKYATKYEISGSKPSSKLLLRQKIRNFKCKLAIKGFSSLQPDSLAYHNYGG